MTIVIYSSPVGCYRICSQEIGELTDVSYSRIHIIGGDANADYLNRLTASATGRTVHAGPVEAATIGDLTVQMMRSGEYENLEDARENITKSSEIKVYGPEGGRGVR